MPTPFAATPALDLAELPVLREMREIFFEGTVSDTEQGFALHFEPSLCTYGCAWKRLVTGFATTRTDGAPMTALLVPAVLVAAVLCIVLSASPTGVRLNLIQTSGNRFYT